jgi:hypothetical protein
LPARRKGPGVLSSVVSGLRVDPAMLERADAIAALLRERTAASLGVRVDLVAPFTRADVIRLAIESGLEQLEKAPPAPRGSR